MSLTLATILTISISAAVDDTMPRDIFIGTLAMEAGRPVLIRCDAAQNRYIVRDAKGAQTVKDWARYGRRAYAEVIATYHEESGKPGLTVFAMENLTPEKSCHLRDPT